MSFLSDPTNSTPHTNKQTDRVVCKVDNKTVLAFRVMYLRHDTKVIRVWGGGIYSVFSCWRERHDDSFPGCFSSFSRAMVAGKLEREANGGEPESASSYHTGKAQVCIRQLNWLSKTTL